MDQVKYRLIRRSYQRNYPGVNGTIGIYSYYPNSKDEACFLSEELTDEVGSELPEEEAIAGFRRQLQDMLAALDQPVVDYDTIKRGVPDPEEVE